MLMDGKMRLKKGVCMVMILFGIMCHSMPVTMKIASTFLPFFTLICHDCVDN